MYHFAYGSNMNIFELKKYLCKNNFKIIGSGYLENYIFTYRTFNNRKLSAKANIETVSYTHLTLPTICSV